MLLQTEYSANYRKCILESHLSPTASIGCLAVTDLLQTEGEVLENNVTAEAGVKRLSAYAPHTPLDPARYKARVLALSWPGC